MGDTTEDVLDDLTEESTEDESAETENTETSEDTEGDEEAESDDQEEADEEDETQDEGSKKKEASKDDDAETKEPLKRPVFTEVKKKYPELFKDFPELRHAFFKGEEYGKLFPTVNDAKEAVSAASKFEYVESELSSGRIGNILHAVGSADPEAFKNIIKDFLPSVYQLDQDSYYELTQPVIENALLAVYKNGISTNNKNLTLAAQYVRKFLLNSAEFETTKKTEDPEKARLVQERDSLVSNQRNQYSSAVSQGIQSELVNLVKDGLDPEGELSPFVLDKLVEDIMRKVDNAIVNDTDVRNILTPLWNRGLRTLDGEVGKRIISTYISKAKEVLPMIKSEAKKNVTKTPSSTKSKTKEAPRRMSGAGTPKTGKGPINPKDIDWSKTSDMDILNDKVTLRK